MGLAIDTRRNRASASEVGVGPHATPAAVGRSSTIWQARQFMERPLKGPGLMEPGTGDPGMVVSTVSTTGSPAFGSFTLPLLSKNTLKACANLVSRNSRSPTACSAPGVPAACALGAPPDDEVPPPEQPVIASIAPRRDERTVCVRTMIGSLMGESLRVRVQRSGTGIDSIDGTRPR